LVLVATAILLFATLRPLTVLRASGEFVLWRNGIHAGYATVGAYRIHYYAGGEGPPIVFVHGLGGDALNWIKPMITLKRQHHRVYALDLLGHGKSDYPDIEYSIEQQSEMLRQFLAAQKLHSPDFVAVSMGGWIVLNLAIEHPENVRRLVVADPAGLYFETPITSDTFVPKTPAEMAALWQLLTPREMAFPAPVTRDFIREVSDRAWVIRRAFASFETRKDLLDGRVEHLNAPVLILWGKQERLIPLQVGEQLHSEIPRSSLLVCPDSGHLAVFECWERFQPSVSGFLDAPEVPAPQTGELPSVK
jgi:pimeloyl-ACP methyl ester carboxylesterase